MATKFANEKEGGCHIETNLDGWKYPKIPVDQVYNSTNTVTLNPDTLLGYTSFWSKAKKLLKIFPSFAVKDFEKTVKLKPNNSNVTLKLLKGLFWKQDRRLHLGLVQIEIKPLLKDGSIDAPIILCLRDGRITDFEKSFLAVVETDISQGPFYFNCFPGYSISLDDGASAREVLTLHVMTNGVPLALTYRVVCKVSSGATIVTRENQILGETTYLHPSTGTQSTTKWDQVVLPESWAAY